MPYLSISDFKYGMDRRRPQTTGIPGTLWRLENAVVSRGGDLLRAKKWAVSHTLPTNTVGLFALRNQLVVFGDAFPLPGIPYDIQYQALVPPAAAIMTRLLHAKSFDGLIYAIADYNTGGRYHYYNGTRITDWDTVSAANTSFAAVARALAGKMSADPAVRVTAYEAIIGVVAKVPGVPFTLTATGIDAGGASTPTATLVANVANVVAVDEVRAFGQIEVLTGSYSPGVNRITDVTVDGVSILPAPVDWILSQRATAAALALAINEAGNSFTAVCAFDTVTITEAEGLGATVNGDVVAVTVAGNVTVNIANIAGGVTKVAAVAQVSTVAIGTGTLDPDDGWSVVLNGTTYAMSGRSAGAGTSAYVQKKRIWSTANRVVRYCVLNGPTDWTTITTPATDAGQFVPDNDSEGAQDLVGMGTYNGNTIIFGQVAGSIYALDANANNIAIQQPIENSGTPAHRSIVNYGATDTFYLDNTGIRSLRTRANSEVAYVDDVGSAIDPFVQQIMSGLTDDQISRAVGIVDPLDGRYVLGLGSQFLMLSYFPAATITAWSYISPGFEIEELVRTYRGMYARSGNTIYKYGGIDGNTYPGDNELAMLVETPFMSAQDPAGLKYLTGVDIDCTNVWHMEILPNPDDPSRVIDAGYVTGNTYFKSAIRLPGRTSHIAVRFTCSKAGPASISSLAIHYEKDMAE